MRSALRPPLFLTIALAMALIPACTDEPVDNDDGDECFGPAYDEEAVTVTAVLNEPFSHVTLPDDEGPTDALLLMNLDPAELPPGLAASITFDTIEGRPTETGTWTVTLTATVQCEDDEGERSFEAQQELTIVVIDACPNIQVTPTFGFVAEVGETVNQTLQANGGQGTLSFAYTGEVPPGLLFDGNTATFTGAITEVGAWEGTITVTDQCPVPQTVDVDVTITAQAVGGDLPAGSYTCPVADSEYIHVEEQVAFGNIEPPYCVVSGSNSWAILSLQAPYFSVLGALFNPGLALFGAVPLAGGGSCDQPAGRFMCSYGANGGFLTGWDEETEEFVASQSIFGQIYDVEKQACSTSAGDSWATMCTSSPPGVRGVYYNPSSGFPEYLPGFYQGSQFENGTCRSATPLSRGGREAFACTDASSPQGAWLYYFDYDLPQENATPVTALGSQPLRVREDGGWWCVTDYTDNTLTCGLTNDGSNAEITATVPVGDGPFGCDVVDLGDGTALAACTGYDDDTYTVVHLDGDGAVISSTTNSLPDGNEDPGHCAFYDGGSKLLITCQGTSTVVVADTGR